MKVLNLQCGHGHGFEGWFASHEDYESQRLRGLVSCPLCNDAEVIKMPSAPRLNLSHGAQEAAGTPAPVSAPQPQVEPMLPQALQSAMLKMVRHVMANTEDVGPQFAEQARRIHYGEAPQRNIRGQASREETEALLDEGVDILPLLLPAGLKEPLQ